MAKVCRRGWARGLRRVIPASLVIIISCHTNKSGGAADALQRE